MIQHVHGSSMTWWLFWFTHTHIGNLIHFRWTVGRRNGAGPFHGIRYAMLYFLSQLKHTTSAYKMHHKQGRNILCETDETEHAPE